MAELLVGILATWRLAHLVFTEGGPYQVFDRLRDLLGVVKDEHGDPQPKDPHNQIALMASCFWCLSVWCALAVQVCQRRLSVARLLAYSAGAIFLGFVGVRLDPDSQPALRPAHANGRVRTEAWTHD